MPRALCRSKVLGLALAVAVGAAHAQGAGTPPADSAALLKWLQAGAYKAWPKESAAHLSMGSHKVLVITYLSPALDQSLHAGSKAHPKGSAAVKELLGKTGQLSGWAVSVKTAADGDGGKGWFWYEILGTAAGSPVVAQAQGVPLCLECHVKGRDAVLSEHPLY